MNESVNTTVTIHQSGAGSGFSLPAGGHRSFRIPSVGRNWLGILRKLLALSGPGYLVAVGYMDPGKLGNRLRWRLPVFLHALIGGDHLQRHGHFLAASGLETGRGYWPQSGPSLPRPFSFDGKTLSFGWDARSLDLAEVVGSAMTSENDSDEILTLDRPSIIVCDYAKRVLFSEATSYSSCGVLKSPLEAPGFNADRLVVSEDD
jgi:hypothetical protein